MFYYAIQRYFYGMILNVKKFQHILRSLKICCSAIEHFIILYIVIFKVHDVMNCFHLLIKKHLLELKKKNLIHSPILAQYLSMKIYKTSSQISNSDFGQIFIFDAISSRNEPINTLMLIFTIQLNLE